MQGDNEKAEDYMQAKLALVSKIHPGDFEIQLDLLKEGVHPRYRAELEAVAWQIDNVKDTPETAKKLFVQILDGIKKKTDKWHGKGSKRASPEEVFVTQTQDDSLKTLDQRVKKQEALLEEILGKMKTAEQQPMRRPRTSSQERPRTPLSMIECWNCGEKGHLSRFCRKPKKEVSQPEESRTTPKSTQGNDNPGWRGATAREF